ncbi:class I SAM-dependent methyltransferase [Sphingobacterium sp. SYP-B4668]|uniref:class I SAM-dependent methyltransferase n=1 Tax=Sphingobacterium sp. SYP-B4668 TaxID=2996035 RepID=UPI0022DE557D|nr:class I SAM-dependent methyltransferase [Sphingobacterium sp. SYP-B4668]
MDNVWLGRWNDRYSEAGYAYGAEPNKFFKETIGQIESGVKILFPADGEGRNSVYAAALGWDVYSFDISEVGKAKAEKLAVERNVSLNYQLGELPKLSYQQGEFDVLALIYAHFPSEIKVAYHKRLIDLLKPGGHIIFEAFSKNHLTYRKRNPGVGGPTDIDSLFSIEELMSDFQGFTFLSMEEVEVQLSEGRYHIGTGSVIRFVARKL